MDTIWSPNLDGYHGAKYQRLVQALRDAIKAGELPAGRKLPPVRDLAWRVNMTPGTVARAYSILTDEGILKAAVGRGTFVATLEKAPVAQDSPIEIDPAPHAQDHTSGPISLFSPAIPNVGQAQLIKQILKALAKDPPSGLMHYPSRDGFRPAREAVVTWLKPAALGPLSEEDIVLCHGGQNGLSLVLQTILQFCPPVVYVEDLSFPGILRAADLLRAQIIPIAMDEHGMSLSALETAVRTHGEGVICTSPEVHNPTCTFTPEERRRDIVTIARRYNLQIVDDDCYAMGGARAPSYRTLAPERAWYVSSISKVITPSLRIGFAISPKERSADLRRAAEHGFFGLATLLGDLTANLLSHPQIMDIARVVAERFGQYIEIALNHLGRYDVQWQPNVPFLWLSLPRGWRAGAFCLAAEARGVRIRPAEEFTCRDARAPHAVRIAVNAVISPERFEAAICVLADLLDNPSEQIGV